MRVPVRLSLHGRGQAEARMTNAQSQAALISKTFKGEVYFLYGEGCRKWRDVAYLPW